MPVKQWPLVFQHSHFVFRVGAHSIVYIYYNHSLTLHPSSLPADVVVARSDACSF